MEQLLNKISEQYGYPADLVARAAAARAQIEGTTREAVAARWAGEEVPAAGAVTPPPSAPVAAAAVPEPPSGPDVEVLEPLEEHDPAEDAPVDVEQDSGPTSVGGLARWLAVAAIIIPIVALTYAFIAPDGPACGASGQLDVDAATGLAVGCDGNAYGAGAVDFFALGEQLYTAQCAACHAADGSGGVGPGFVGGAILDTFPGDMCADQKEWITLGSAGWAGQNGETYGANARAVLGFSGVPMPGFASLTDDELSAVAIFERVAFGNESIDAAEAACLSSGEPTG
ncbi:MAG TPA: c-type cytochrome [Actinobacteria bacterium]|nr:c-type cytochrome [Actinomycetota bacterium]